MVLMRNAWIDFFDARARLGEQISGLLGEDHDLAVLKTFAAAHIGKGVSAKQSETIFKLAQKRQDELRGQAKELAETLFAVSPKALAAETKTYWNSAKSKTLEESAGKAAKPIAETLPLAEERDDEASAG